MPAAWYIKTCKRPSHQRGLSIDPGQNTAPVPPKVTKTSLLDLRASNIFRGWKHAALPPQSAAISNLHNMDLHAKFFEYNGASVPQSPSQRHVASIGNRSHLHAFHLCELSRAVVWAPRQRSHSEPRMRDNPRYLKQSKSLEASEHDRVMMPSGHAAVPTGCAVHFVQIT